jgi:hypothetical protein
MQVKEIIFDPSTIETIDMGLYNWADNTLALHTTTNEGWKKVPVVWLGSERGRFQAHYNEKDDYKGGTVTITRRIQQEKTRNFTNADIARLLKDSRETGPQLNNKHKTVYQEITIPVPSYVTVMYSIIIRTEYQQQMNDLVAPFITGKYQWLFLRTRRL